MRYLYLLSPTSMFASFFSSRFISLHFKLWLLPSEKGQRSKNGFCELSWFEGCTLTINDNWCSRVDCRPHWHLINVLFFFEVRKSSIEVIVFRWKTVIARKSDHCSKMYRMENMIITNDHNPSNLVIVFEWNEDKAMWY